MCVCVFARENIFREVTICASLQHKNVVSMFEFYCDKKRVGMHSLLMIYRCMS